MGHISAVRPKLFFHNVSLERKSKRRTATDVRIKDFSFLLHGNEAIGVLGTRSDGAGLVAELACGTVASDEGSVYVAAEPAGITSGTAFLLDDSLRYNMERVGMSHNVNGGALRALVSLVADEAGAADELSKLVRDCDALLVEHVRLCLAIASGSPLLVIDEPEVRGQALTEQEGQRRLRTYKAHGGAVLVVSQNARLLAKTCRRTVWLHEGKILMDDASEVVARRHRQHADAVKDGDRALAGQLVRRFRRQVKSPQFIIQEAGRRRA
ncbi:hypothetical protein [Arthrobacter sp. KK5.5]|uniref:hypothetical protein n=1 Tax=Arthrobacter sp. KK5.5 TaxID=3373084 RepID=UPI003EE567C2